MERQNVQAPREKGLHGTAEQRKRETESVRWRQVGGVRCNVKGSLGSGTAPAVMRACWYGTQDKCQTKYMPLAVPRNAK